MWMNEYEVTEAVSHFDPSEVPHLAQGAQVLQSLMDWTNSNSDGWPYWSKPSKAASSLMELLHAHLYAARFGYYQGTAERLHDVTPAELTKALAPIKAFLTRQKVDHAATLPWAAIL